MKREKPISINQSLRCARVYPVEASDRDIADLETRGLDLTPEQAAKFATALQKGASNRTLGFIRVVAFRKVENDGTHRLTVRGFKGATPSPRRSRKSRLQDDDEDFI
jgi:hypothetical protein